jgi:hypothetical protein
VAVGGEEEQEEEGREGEEGEEAEMEMEALAVREWQEVWV